MTNPIDELIEKLNARTPSRRSYMFGEEGGLLINPDGPAAATALTSLQERTRKLEEALGDILSAPSVVEAYGSICRARALLSGAGE